MIQQKKKTPSEYPLFAIRLTEDQKAQLGKLVDEVRCSLNAKLSENEKMWMKNDVVFHALMIGLPMLKKKARRED